MQLYHGENKLGTLYEMMMSTLYDNKRLSGNFISLAHSNNSLQVNALLNSNTLSWFQANQCLLILACA